MLISLPKAIISVSIFRGAPLFLCAAFLITEAFVGTVWLAGLGAAVMPLVLHVSTESRSCCYPYCLARSIGLHLRLPAENLSLLLLWRPLSARLMSVYIMSDLSPPAYILLSGCCRFLWYFQCVVFRLHGTFWSYWRERHWLRAMQ